MTYKLPGGPTSYVYFAQVGAHIKIGYSTQVEKRIKRLKFDASARPDMLDHSAPIVLLGIIPNGDKSDEFLIHEQLDEWRVAGEWFHAVAEVDVVIDTYLTYADRWSKRRSRNGVRYGRAVLHDPVPEPQLDVSPEVLDSFMKIRDEVTS